KPVLILVLIRAKSRTIIPAPQEYLSMDLQQQQLIDAATKVIGAGRSNDYEIEPTRHADELASTAPALATILRQPEFSVLSQQYEQKDQRAVGRQAKFKKTAAGANWAVLLTACFSALLLVTGSLTSVMKGVSAHAFLVIFG